MNGIERERRFNMGNQTTYASGGYGDVSKISSNKRIGRGFYSPVSEGKRQVGGCCSMRCGSGSMRWDPYETYKGSRIR